MKETELVYLHALNTIYGLGAQKMRLLLAFFGCAQAAWEAKPTQLRQAGLSKALSEAVANACQTKNPQTLWQQLQQEDITALAYTDSNYPALLREIPLPPYLIYTKGNLSLLGRKSIAVVGSRAHTTYGKQTTYALAQDLARAGVVVVSGLALGIDAIAHRGALDAHGDTIAVLGNSLDAASIHPRTNFQLAQEILAKGGLLVSEYPPITPPTNGSFPARNRIMAGLSQGTLVIEAAPQSGSLITANLALEFNREVYAVPGPIFAEQSRGTNELIKRGAKIVTSAQDILEEFSFAEAAVKIDSAAVLEKLTEAEKKLFNLLSSEPLHVDRLIKLSKLETSAVISTLAILEMKSLAKNMGGQNYVRL